MHDITRRGFIKGAAALLPLAAVSTEAAQAAGARAGQSASVPERFDFVVAGAGHNSLVCAAYLAKAGFKVLVLEGRPTIGGGCKTQEVCLPGFKEDLCSSVHSGFQSNPAQKELSLRDYGLEYLEPDPVVQVPFQDGTSITVWRDLNRTCETIARFSPKDAETFRRVTLEYKSYLADERARSSDSARASSPRPADYWQRLFALSGYDAACALFESRQMRAAAISCGHFGGVPASDINTGAQALSMCVQVLNGRTIAKGGSGMLSVSLGNFLEAHNAVVLTNKPVVRLMVEGGKCVGVECMDGSHYRAEKAVISTIHIKHLVDMVPHDLWGDEFLHDLEIFQPEQAMFSFHYATSEPPKYALAGGGTISTNEAAIMERPESIFSLNPYNARGELFLEDTPLQIVSPSVGDPSRAPAGYHTVKIEGSLPYGLKEGPAHWDVIKEQVAETIFGRLRRVAPNLTPGKILAKFLESPIDIERMNPAMWRGSVHHGDRRLPQFASYRTPIPGLYQTGACTAPGGSITGIPGRNSAAVILKDNGTSIEEVGRKA
jgi:phytoene dehydrogenase-like protein